MQLNWDKSEDLHQIVVVVVVVETEKMVVTN